MYMYNKHEECVLQTYHRSDIFETLKIVGNAK